MNRKRILLGASLAFISTPALSNIDGWEQESTRAQALQGNYFNLKDSSNIWANPAQIFNYSNRATFEFGTFGTSVNTGSQWGGVTLDSPFGVIGAYVGRPYRDGSAASTMQDMDHGIINYDDFDNVHSNALLTAGQTGILFDLTGQTGILEGQTGTYLTNFSPARNPQNRFDLFYGLELGEAKVGLRVNYASQDSITPGEGGTYSIGTTTINTVSANENTQEGSEFNFVLGAMMEDVSLFSSAEAVMTLGIPSFSAESKLNDRVEVKASDNDPGSNIATNISEKLESDGNINLGFLVRGEIELSNESSFLISGFLGIENNDAILKASRTTTDASATGANSNLKKTDVRGDSLTRFGGAVAYNWKPNDKNTLVTSLGFGLASKEVKITKTTDEDSSTTAGVIKYNSLHGLRSSSTTEYSGFNTPLVVSLENQTTKKLVTRFSISKNLFYGNKTETSSTLYDEAPSGGNVPSPTKLNAEKSASSSETNEPFYSRYATIGLGLSYSPIESLVIDGVVNQDMAFTGTNLLSGIQDTLFTRLTVTYNF